MCGIFKEFNYTKDLELNYFAILSQQHYGH